MSIEDYSTLEDLAFSRSFRNWVLNPEGPEADFWTNWVAHNPEKGELVNQAKAAIAALELNLKPLPGRTIDTEVRKVVQKIKDGRVNAVREIPLRNSLLGRRPARTWTVAAIIAAVAILLILFRIFRQ
ncbi:MAG TPA: hypothetical protein VHE34_23380 [Puia sp.]|uniref:hypothetical protein n=1 Tax=Puia sp. TaxID=2045100 RepID=UPI002B80EB78|nr:hypothetical protein [Puia sp.]HVU98193.1 hypothetical protein [Puia sp.]